MPRLKTSCRSAGDGRGTVGQDEEEGSVFQVRKTPENRIPIPPCPCPQTCVSRQFSGLEVHILRPMHKEDL